MSDRGASLYVCANNECGRWWVLDKMVATPGKPLHQVARLAVTWSMVLSGPSPVCPLP